MEAVPSYVQDSREARIYGLILQAMEAAEDHAVDFDAQLAEVREARES